MFSALRGGLDGKTDQHAYPAAPPPMVKKMCHSSPFSIPDEWVGSGHKISVSLCLVTLPARFPSQCMVNGSAVHIAMDPLAYCVVLLACA